MSYSLNISVYMYLGMVVQLPPKKKILFKVCFVEVGYLV